MKSWHVPLKLVVCLFAFQVANAQTSIDLRTQAKNVDFSKAASTKPSKTGTELPASCEVGETFFKTDAAVGRNLYFCTSANVWSQMSGGGSSGQFGAAALLEVSGGGTKAQTTDGGLPENAVPIIDATGKSVDSGCTGAGGSTNCPNGFTSGSGASQITMTEGATPPGTALGKQTLYLDAADHRAKFIDSAASVHALPSTSGALPAGDVAVYDSSGNLTAAGCSLIAGVLVCRLGTGTAVTISSWFEFPAAACQGTVGFLGFDVPAANAPTANCATGTNTTLGIATFTAAAQGGQTRFVLPDDWAAGAGNELEFRFRSPSSGGTGNVVWKAHTACATNPGGSVDPAFNAAQTASAPAQPNNLTNKATLSGFSTTGCSAGDVMFVKFSLDGTTTATGNQDLLSLRIKLKRTVTAL